MDHKIGIGVTSFNRIPHFELFRSQLTKHKVLSEFSSAINVVGIVNAKNKCLSDLKDCDYIFLFDDDCFPIADGWAEYFINEHKRTGNHHFMYLNYSHRLIENKDGINVYQGCGGCFMFLTKEVIEKVGYYYNGYGQYGFEHAGYSNRIHQAGLTPSGMYLCPDKASEYIYSLDLDPPRFDIKHKPSLPLTQITKLAKENFVHYQEDIKQVYRSI